MDGRWGMSTLPGRTVSCGGVLSTSAVRGHLRPSFSTAVVSLGFSSALLSFFTSTSTFSISCWEGDPSVRQRPWTDVGECPPCRRRAVSCSHSLPGRSQRWSAPIPLPLLPLPPSPPFLFNKPTINKERVRYGKMKKKLDRWWLTYLQGWPGGWKERGSAVQESTICLKLQIAELITRLFHHIV